MENYLCIVRYCTILYTDNYISTVVDDSYHQLLWSGCFELNDYILLYLGKKLISFSFQEPVVIFTI